MDFIDDLEVTKALLEQVVVFGLENKLEYMEGPMGFLIWIKLGL
jgi:hypothetical protein